MGGSAAGFDAWCEACQLAQPLPAAPGPSACCARCGTRLYATPRFVELCGMLQQLDAVLAAWDGDAAPLAMLLPERPTFLTDLTPPEAREDDPAPLRRQLAALARGDWRAVLDAPDGSPTGPAAGPAAGPATGPATGPAAPAAGRSMSARGHAAVAIAHERAGDPAAAIAAWDRVLAAGEDERARLARGSLLARAGREKEATADLRLAGDSFAAGWTRAALLVLEAADHGGALDAARLARARAEAGEPSPYWSDPTVGRLLFWRLVARALAADASGPSADGARRASAAECARLHAAEREVEHDTFWDRALLLVGWARVGAPREVARVAAPLARGEADALAAEPALAGAPLHEAAAAVAAAIGAIEAREPERARRALAGALARVDLRRFRLPCAHCGRGSIGVDEVREAPPDTP